MDRKQERKSICTTYDDSNGCSHPSRFHSTGTAAERKQRHLYCIYIYIPGRMAGETCFICTTTKVLRHRHVTVLEPICSQVYKIQDTQLPMISFPHVRCLELPFAPARFWRCEDSLPMSVALASREQPRRRERQPIRLHPPHQRSTRAGLLACDVHKRQKLVNSTCACLGLHSRRSVVFSKASSGGKLHVSEASKKTWAEAPSSLSLLMDVLASIVCLRHSI